MYTYFEFKNCKIAMHPSVFKVGTDGVLLAAWIPNNNQKHILEIGTGTGVIATILYNKLNTPCIDAIDISEEAIQLANYNFKMNRCENATAIYSDITKWQPNKMYDLIVCNPPFFKDALQPKSEVLKNAKHIENLDLEAILKYSEKWTASNCKIYIIYPFLERSALELLGKKYGLFLTKHCSIYPKENKKANRVLIEYSTKEETLIEEKLTIYNLDNSYTKEYVNLTQAFYLKM